MIMCLKLAIFKSWLVETMLGNNASAGKNNGITIGDSKSLHRYSRETNDNTCI